MSLSHHRRGILACSSLQNCFNSNTFKRVFWARTTCLRSWLWVGGSKTLHLLVFKDKGHSLGDANVYILDRGDGLKDDDGSLTTPTVNHLQCSLEIRFPRGSTSTHTLNRVNSTGLTQDLTVISSEASGGNDPLLSSQFGSCDDGHDY